MVVAVTPPEAPTETAYAAEQKQHLVKTLGRFDMIFFTVAVIVGLDLIGQAASNGYQAFTWTVVLVACGVAVDHAGDVERRLD